MTIEFGMPTLIELSGLEENARLCHDLGLKFIELNMNLPEYQVEALQKTDAFQAAADTYGVYYTIHLDENLNIGDFNAAVANAYRDTVRRTLQIAKTLKIPLLNMHMHPGVHFTLPDRKVFLFEKYADIYLNSIRTFKSMCEDIIGGGDMVIAIENTDGFTAIQKEALDILLESPVFALTWDIGHCHGANDVDEAFILQHRQKLKHFHIHDASGKQNHLALGTGDIDLTARLGIAAQNGCRCVIETKTAEALRQSVRWLTMRIGGEAL